MRIKYILLFILVLLSSLASFSQVGIGTTNPDTSAILDVTSTTRGFLPPRLTTIQRKGIITPADGLAVFDTDANAYYYYANSTWIQLHTSSTVTQSPIGSLYVSSPKETYFTDYLPAKIAGTTTEIMSSDTTVGTNRITYIGKETRCFFYNVSISMTSTSPNQTYYVYLYKYDDLAGTTTEVPGSRMGVRISVGADVVSASISGMVKLNTSDYLEVWGESSTSDECFTAKYMNFTLAAE